MLATTLLLCKDFDNRHEIGSCWSLGGRRITGMMRMRCKRLGGPMCWSIIDLRAMRRLRWRHLQGCWAPGKTGWHVHFEGGFYFWWKRRAAGLDCPLTVQNPYSAIAVSRASTYTCKIWTEIPLSRSCWRTSLQHMRRIHYTEAHHGPSWHRVQLYVQNHAAIRFVVFCSRDLVHRVLFWKCRQHWPPEMPNIMWDIKRWSL